MVYIKKVNTNHETRRDSVMYLAKEGDPSQHSKRGSLCPHFVVQRTSTSDRRQPLRGSLLHPRKKLVTPRRTFFLIMTPQAKKKCSCPATTQVSTQIYSL